MGYVLYGAYGSGSSIVEAALSEIGAPYTFERIDAANHAQRGAAYTAVNPHQKIPTLILPSGETLTESVAIVLTLAEHHPSAALLPPVGDPDRARALRWMLFAATELYPVVEIIDYPERFAPDKDSKPGVRERALEIWRKRWLTAEGTIDEGPYVLGQRFSIADVYFAALSKWDLTEEWCSKNIPKVMRVAAAVAARPKLRTVWANNFPKR